jgi:hypothetical protein
MHRFTTNQNHDVELIHVIMNRAIETMSCMEHCTAWTWLPTYGMTRCGPQQAPVHALDMRTAAGDCCGTAPLHHTNGQRSFVTDHECTHVRGHSKLWSCIADADGLCFLMPAVRRQTGSRSGAPLAGGSATSWPSRSGGNTMAASPAHATAWLLRCAIYRPH